MKSLQNLRPRRVVEEVCRNAERVALSRSSSVIVFLLEFVGCTFFPLPVALILVALVTAAPKKWLSFALSATAGSLAGGILFYVIGRTFFISVGEGLIAFYGAEAKWAEAVSWFNGSWGLAFVLFAGITTGLFRVATLAAGFTGMNPLLFFLLLTTSRCARFVAECGTIRYLGDRARTRSIDYLKYATAGAVVLALATVVIIGFTV
jgi:membrane protein YqaA with SNARE-associated domain